MSVNTNTTTQGDAGRTIGSGVLPAFPSEGPTIGELTEWLKRAEDHFSKTGYGPIRRGETPPALLELEPRDLSGLPVLVAVDGGATASDVARRNEQRDAIIYKNTIMRKKLDASLNEIKNRMAAEIATAMRASASLLHSKLQTAATISGTAGEPDALVDGNAMMDELVKMKKGDIGLHESESAMKAIERERDTPLPDTCTMDDYLDKVKKVKETYLPYTDTAYSDKLKTLLFVKFMPSSLDADMRQILRDLKRDGKLDDFNHAVDTCAESIKMANGTRVD